MPSDQLPIAEIPCASRQPSASLSGEPKRTSISSAKSGSKAKKRSPLAATAPQFASSGTANDVRASVTIAPNSTYRGTGLLKGLEVPQHVITGRLYAQGPGTTRGALITPPRQARFAMTTPATAGVVVEVGTGADGTNDNSRRSDRVRKPRKRYDPDEEQGRAKMKSPSTTPLPVPRKKRSNAVVADLEEAVSQIQNGDRSRNGHAENSGSGQSGEAIPGPGPKTTASATSRARTESSVKNTDKSKKKILRSDHGLQSQAGEEEHPPNEEQAPSPNHADAADDDAEEEGDPVWDDFAAEHYEIIDQLPLELHRNFALLRELDDQTQQHTARLLELIRQYVVARLKPDKVPSGLNDVIPDPQTLNAAEGPDTALPVKTNNGFNNETGPGHTSVSDIVGKTAMGEPSQPTQQEPAASAASTDLTSLEQTQIATSTQPSETSAPTPMPMAGPSASLLGQKRDPPKPGTVEYEEKLRSLNLVPASQLFLPQIGKRSQEMLRSADEKVGIASAAYDLSENVNMGVRLGSMPSGTLVNQEEIQTQADDPHEAAILGMTGGTAELPNSSKSQKGKKGRPKRKEELLAADALTVGMDKHTGQAVVLGPAETTMVDVPDMPVDQHEPRYCLCNNVGYGVMVACENPTCPKEWFHLACVQMTKAPEGKWWCPICLPQRQALTASGNPRKKQKKK